MEIRKATLLDPIQVHWPLFYIASYCNMFGLRIFIERHICLQYMDTEYISKPDFSAGAQYCKNTYHSFMEKSLD